MGKRIDLAGQRFGKLVVLSPTEERADNGSIVWECRCDCGSTAAVPARRLVRGKVRSCGCLSHPPRKDYVGKRFGRLTVEQLNLLEGTSVTILERNKRHVRKDNKSGCTGVFREADGRWSATINFRKKRYWLGRFSNREDAVKARLRGEELHDGFLEWYYGTYKTHEDPARPESQEETGATDKRTGNPEYEIKKGWGLC